MNTFGTRLLRIGRPWLGVPLLAIACQEVGPHEIGDQAAGANPNENSASIGEPRSSLTGDPGSDPRDDSSDTSEQHLLITVSYENGVFNAERVKRVPGPLREPRSGQVQGKMAFLARGNSSTLLVAAAPDPRSVHFEFQEPDSQHMDSVSVPAPGKQYFLIHAPLTTDAVDFFDNVRKITPATSRLDESAASAERAPQSLLGSVTLEGLL